MTTQEIKAWLMKNYPPGDKDKFHERLGLLADFVMDHEDSFDDGLLAHLRTRNREIVEERDLAIYQRDEGVKVLKLIGSRIGSEGMRKIVPPRLNLPDHVTAICDRLEALQREYDAFKKPKPISISPPGNPGGPDAGRREG